MLTFTLEQFCGSALELSAFVRKSKLDHKSLPVLDLVNQAMAQVEALGLSERAELLPVLSELVLFKIQAFAHKPAEVWLPDTEEFLDDEIQPSNVLDTLNRLEGLITFLGQRALERAKVVPIPASPMPKDKRLRSLHASVLLKAAQPFKRKAELRIEPERFGLKEAWERIKQVLQSVKSSMFSQLPLATWSEKTIGFVAILEAKRQNELDLVQHQAFEDIEIGTPQNKLA